MNFKCFPGLTAISFLLVWSVSHARTTDTIPFIDSRLILREGIELFEQGKYKEAIDTYTLVSRNDTNYANVLFELSRTCIADSQFSRSIAYATEGLKLNSEYDMYFYEHLISSYGSGKMPDKALEAFNEGISKFPQNYRLYHHLAFAYYRAKKFKEATHYFQETVRINPLYSNAHYMLGLLCAYNNQFVPAMLALQTSIVLEPKVNRSLQALLIMQEIAKGQLKVDPDTVVNITNYPAENNFDELEQVIRSQVAIDAKYKTKVQLSYTEVIKQLQVLAEQIRYNPDDKGFWMQQYAPFYVALWKEKLFDPFAYNLFLSVEDKVTQAQIARNEPAIEKMRSWAGDFLGKPRALKMTTLGGKEQMAEHWYYDGGLLQAVGDFDVKAKISRGDWRTYHRSGYLQSEGAFDEKGQKTGEWKYYSQNGRLESTEVLAKGIGEGPFIRYYPNGVIDEQKNFSANKLNGVVTAYHEAGAVSAKLSFTNGERNGEAFYYHPNGLLLKKFTYRNGLVEGPMQGYHDNGRPEFEAVYKNDKINGLYKYYYYYSGNLNYEGNMVNDVAEGEWKWYHENGQLSKIGSYVSGKEDGVWKTFYENGKPESEMTYKAGLQYGSSKDYDEDGILFSDWEYVKNDLKKMTYYDKSGKIIHESAEKNGKLDVIAYSPLGVKIREGKAVDGFPEGEWKEYYASGPLYSVVPFKKGKQNGLAKYYYRDGTLSEETPYMNGQKEGYYKSYYNNGGLSQEGWFKNDEPEGTWLKYYSNGKIENNTWFLEGKNTGYEIDYNTEGKIESEWISEYGYFSGAVEYDTAGNKINEAKLKNGNGLLTLYHMNKKPGMIAIYKYGKKDGEVKHYFANGQVRLVDHHLNGMRHGSYKLYYDNGVPDTEGFYKYGKRDSTWKIYDEDGRSRIISNYRNGNLHGDWKRYYPNGNPEVTGNYKSDERDGFFTYLYEDGSIQLRLHYLSGKLTGYTYPDKQGNLLPEVPVINQTARFTTYYQNGSSSADLNYLYGSKEGKNVFYHPNGKIESEQFLKSGDREGVYRSYYANGNLKEEETYYADDLNGVCRYYAENGTLLKEIPYLLGQKHGTARYYSNQKPVRSVHYVFNEPYE